MTIEVKTKQGGNSIGIIIPKEVVNTLKIKPEETILIEVEKKENPLKELWGFGKGKKLTQKARLENRKFLESKWM